MPRPEPLNEPIRFGPYELTHRLGAGVTGETYRARYQGPSGEQWYAIKFTYDGYSEHESFARTLGEIAGSTARLNHSHIIAPLDFGLTNGRHFLVSPLVRGLDLDTALIVLAELGRRVPSMLVAKIGASAVRVLDHAHRIMDLRQSERIGFVHRHLCPTNILLGRDGEVRLSDFGQTAAFSALPMTLQPRAALLPWLAPEIARGGAPSVASDIFSLGLVLYQALSGKHPYEDAPDLETAVAYARIPEMPRRAALPPPLVELIERMIDPDPDVRGGDIFAYHEALLECSRPPHPTIKTRSLSEWLQTLGQHVEGLSSPSAIEQLLPEPTVDAASLHSSVIDVIDSYQYTAALGHEDDMHAALNSAPSSNPLPPGIEYPVQTLLRGFQRVQEQGPRSYWLFGGRATGKSFLLRHIMNLFSERDCTVHTAYLTPVCPSRPLSAPGLWLEDAAGLLSTEDRADAKHKLSALATRLSLIPPERASLECLGGLKPLGSMEPEALFERTLGILEKYLKKLSSAGSVALAIDNIQFLDQVSLRFLHALMLRVTSLPVLFLYSCDDESLKDIFAPIEMRTLRLKEPDLQSRERIIYGLLGHWAAYPELTSRLTRSTESISRLSELIAQLHTRSPSPDRVMEVVERMLSVTPKQRLEQTMSGLSGLERQTTLWLAASIEPLNIYSLLSLLGCDKLAFLQSLQRLLQSGLIIYALPRRLAMCTWDVGMAVLELEETTLVQELHRYLGQQLNARSWSGEGSPNIPWVQEQLALSHNIDGALKHATAFARALSSAGFSEVAIVHLDRSLYDLQRSHEDTPLRRARLQSLKARQAHDLGRVAVVRQGLDEVYWAAQQTPDALALRIEALLLDAQSLISRGDFNGARQYLQQTEQEIGLLEHAQNTPNVRLAGMLLLTEAHWALEFGEPNLALDHLERARPLISASTPLLIATITGLRSRVYTARGELQRARADLDTIQQHLKHSPHHPLQIFHALAMGEWYAVQQHVTESIEQLQLASRLAFQSGHLLMLLDSMGLMIETATRWGHFDIAATTLESVWALPSISQDMLGVQRIQQTQRWLHALQYPSQETLAALQQDMQLAEQREVPREMLRVAGFLRVVWSRLGHHAEAQAIYEREVRECHIRGYPPPREHD